MYLRIILNLLTCKILSFQNFFRKYAPSDNGPYGISAEVMDTYVKSCGKFDRLFPSIDMLE